MNKLRLHFAIVILCCFSFVLLAGNFTFRKTGVDLDAYEKPTTGVKGHHNDRLVNVKEFKKISSQKTDDLAVKNGRIK